jgi:murein DD-endopeptidase MepM/ murein hydrolase activator NlpD
MNTPCIPGQLPPASPWPAPSPIPSWSGNGRRMTAAPARAWLGRQAFRRPAARASLANAPVRVSDHLATRRRTRRWQALAASVFALTLLSGVARDLRNHIWQLSSDLSDERHRNLRLVDSVANYQVALDSRIQRVVTLQRRAGGIADLPIAGRVSSGFTTRRLHPQLNIWKPHRGIDIPARAGTLVHPVVPGRVLQVGRTLGYGLFVEVNHGSGIITRYAHLRATHLRPGQLITPAMSVGEVGTSGFSTAPHLHYEVMQLSRHLDPLAYRLLVIERVPTSFQRVAANATAAANGATLLSSRASRQSSARRTPEPAISVRACSSTASSCAPPAASVDSGSRD